MSVIYLTVVYVKAEVNILPQLVLHHKAVVAVQVLAQDGVEECGERLHIVQHQPDNRKTNYACACMSVLQEVNGSQLTPNQTLAHLKIEATGTNTSLLGTQDQIEIEIQAYLWWPVFCERPRLCTSRWLAMAALQRQTTVCVSFCT